MKAAEYRRLLSHASDRAEEPAESWIESAEYEATLRGRTLHGDALVLDIRRRTAKTALLPLEPVNLAVSDFRWEGVGSLFPPAASARGQPSPEKDSRPLQARSAVWGRAPDGRTVVLVDRDAGRLQGTWSARGRLAHGEFDRIEFDLRFPAATASRLRLRLPEGRRLSSSAGNVAPPRPAGDGWSLWEVHLGSRSRCRLTVDDPRSAPGERPLILAESDLTYVIGEEGVHLQARLVLEALGGPLNDVQLALPEDLKVFAVTYGGQAPLTWRVLERSGQRLRIHLPEPLRGRSRSIQIDAFAPLEFDRLRRLPGLRPLGAVFLSGQSQVTIKPPLVLRRLETSGCRQIKPFLADASGETYTFDRYLPGAQISMSLGRPAPALEANSLVHLAAGRERLTFRGETRWSANAGAVYSVQYRVPDGWNITDVRLRDVRSGSDDEARTQSVNWYWKSAPGSWRLLTVDLPDAVIRDRPAVVTVVGQRPRRIPSQAIRLPVIEPLRCESATWFLAVTDTEKTPAPRTARGNQSIGQRTAGDAHPALRELSGVERIDSDAVKDTLADFTVWKTIVKSAGGPAVLLRSSAANASGEVVFGGGRPAASQGNESSPEPELPPAANKTERTTRGDVVVQSGSSINVGYASLSLSSTISAVGSGPDVHRARYVLLRPVTLPEFRFELPESVVLRSVRVNGRAVSAHYSGTGLVVPAISNARVKTIDVVYHTSPRGGFLHEDRRIDLPRMPFTVVDVRWRFTLPDELQPLSEPSGLRLSQPADRLAWTRRFFGPLGRSGRAELFNPFAAESWRDLWRGLTGSGERNGDAEHSGGERTSVWTATGFTDSARLTLPLWNRSRGRLLAWTMLIGCLTTGLLLRMLRLPRRGRIAAAAFSISLIAAWLLSPPYAQIAGGCFAGTILAFLIPRRMLLRSKRNRPDETVPLGSTASFVRAAAGAGALLLGSAVLFAPARAQEPMGRQPPENSAQSSQDPARGDRSAGELRTMVSAGSGDSRRAAGDRHQTPGGARPAQEGGEPDAGNKSIVYVPVADTAGEQTDIRLVYMHPELHERLSQRSMQTGSNIDHIVSSARYALRVENGSSGLLTANYHVVLPGDGETTRVRLPIEGAHLDGPDACRIDSSPQPVIRAADGRGFVVQVSRGANAARWSVGIELRMRVPLDASASGGRFRLTVPPVADSRLTLELPPGTRQVQVPGARGRVRREAGNPTVTAETGPTPILEAWWSSEAAPPTPVELEAASHCLVEAWPTHLKMNYTVDAGVLKGALDSFAMRLPAGAIVRRVSGFQRGQAPVTVTAFDKSVAGRKSDRTPSAPSTLADDGQRLLVEFSERQTDSFSIAVECLLPIRRPKMDRLRVPAIDPLSGVAPPDRSRPIVVKVLANRIAVNPGAGLELAVPAAPRDGLVALAPQEFQQGSRRESFAPQPQLAWRIERPASLEVRLTPRVPRRSVRQEDTAEVHEERIRWTTTARVDTSAAPVFRHTLQVDPRLKIESASVREDGVERLVRWIRRGESVDLILAGQTTGEQIVTVHATAPLELDRLNVLPGVRFESAETSEAAVTIIHEPRLIVALPRSDALQAAGAAPAPRITAEGRVRLGPFSSTGGPLRMPFRVFARRDRVKMHSAVMLHRLNDGRYGYLGAFRFHDSTAAVPRIELTVTDALAQEFDLRAIGAAARREGDGEGSSIVLTPDKDAGGRFTLILSATLDPPVGRPWKLPAVKADAVSSGEHYLILRDPLERFAPADDAQRISSERLPPWIRDVMELPPPSPATTSFRRPDPPVAGWLLRDRPESATDAPRVALMETRCRSESDGDYGRTIVVFAGPAPGEIRFSWPDGLNPRGAFADGVPLPLETPSNGRLTIKPAGVERPAILRVDWLRPRADSWPRLGRVSYEVPQLEGLDVERRLVTILPPPQARLFAAGGFGPDSAASAALSRLEGLLAAVRARPASDDPRPHVWLWLESDYRSLEESAEAGRLSDAEFLRLKSLAADLQELRERLPTAARRPGGAAETGPVTDSPHEAVHGSIPSTGPGGEIGFWAIAEAPLRWVLAVAVFLLIGPIVRRIIRLETGQWLALHPAVALIILGLIWWSCLVAGPLGLALTAGATAWLVTRRGAGEELTR